MSVAVRSFDDLEWNGRPHLFDLGRIELPADQTLYGVECVGRIRHCLPLGDLADKPFVLVCEPDDGRRCAATFFVRNDLHRSVFKNGNAAVGCTEVNSDYFAHSWGPFDLAGLLVGVFRGRF